MRFRFTEISTAHVDIDLRKLINLYYYLYNTCEGFYCVIEFMSVFTSFYFYCVFCLYSLEYYAEGGVCVNLETI